MTSKRQIIGRIFAILLGILTLVFIVVHFVFPLHHEAPVALGIEMGPDQKVARRLVFEGSHRTICELPAACGVHPIEIRYDHFFLEMPDAPKQELKFLSKYLPNSIINEDLCQPVQNTPLWVAVGFFQPGSQINVVVFDPAGVKASRVIAASGHHAFWLENGNRTLHFSANNTTGSYDVISNTIT